MDSCPTVTKVNKQQKIVDELMKYWSILNTHETNQSMQLLPAIAFEAMHTKRVLVHERAQNFELHNFLLQQITKQKLQKFG